MTKPKRILWADLTRGLAALGVIAYHMDVPGAEHLFVLVDLFFVLSGFVLSRSIDRIQSSADWRRFMLKRLYRFMPLVWMALFVRVALAFSGTLIGKPCDSAECQAIPVISAALMLQILVPVSLTVMGPLWSLSVELVVNAGYAFPVSRRRNFVFSAIVFGVAFLLFTYFVPAGDIPGFADRGFARGVFAFGLGLAINYLPKLRTPALVYLPALALSLIVCFVGLGFQPLFGTPVFALLVWGLSSIKVETENSIYVAIASILGNASFGIYVWHGAFRGVAQMISRQVGFDPHGAAYPFSNFLILASVSIALALFTYKFVEMPIMRNFEKRHPLTLR